MNCPECKSRMKIARSIADEEALTRYRQYRCPRCHKTLCTVEAEASYRPTMNRINFLMMEQYRSHQKAKEAKTAETVTTEQAIAFCSVVNGANL